MLRMVETAANPNMAPINRVTANADGLAEKNQKEIAQLNLSLK